jgi:hypothetical protein
MDLKNCLATTAEVVLAHRRLAVLRHLIVMSEYRSNELMLSDILNRQGISSSWNEIRDCLRFLEEHDAIAADMTDRLMVVRLTQRGQDIALGRTTIGEIAAPAPDCAY